MKTIKEKVEVLVHQDKTRYQCSYCGFEAEQKDTIITHEIQKHCYAKSGLVSGFSEIGFLDEFRYSYTAYYFEERDKFDIFLNHQHCYYQNYTGEWAGPGWYMSKESIIYDHDGDTILAHHFVPISTIISDFQNYLSRLEELVEENKTFIKSLQDLKPEV
jgi:hypothetical protein